MKFLLLILFSLATLQLAISWYPPNCGEQGENAACPLGRCCSIYGYCGITPEYCGQDQCQNNCVENANGVASIVSPDMFDQMFRHRNDSSCQGKGFYTYKAFVNAAKTFRGFGTTGDYDTRVREVAAFLAQTSHQTTGGRQGAVDGPYAWGYCILQEKNPPNNYCDSDDWPCPAGCQYYGRGPIQLSRNYNYGLAGRALGLDLINHPDILATNATASFRAAIWFWMTAQPNKPSIHDVFTGRWTPSPADKAARRVPGYGLITNIINGGIECGKGQNDKVVDRIGFYRRYCRILGVSPGKNLDCYKQKPFGSE